MRLDELYNQILAIIDADALGLVLVVSGAIVFLVMGLFFRWKNHSRVGAVHLTGTAMGTFYHITAYRLPRNVTPDFLKKSVDSTLNLIEEKMSMYRKESELSRFNSHSSQQPFTMSQETAEVFRISRQVSQESGGAFDITLGPLVNAWGFGPERVNGDPDEATIAILLKQIGYQWVEIFDDNTVVKRHPEVSCDLSAVAKGYGVDQVAGALDRMGVSNYLVEVGGEVRTKGVNPDGQNWRLAIEKPVDEEQNHQLVVGLSGVSLATSGDYRIFRMKNGERISHEIDPKTGRPITHPLASVSVIHPSCAWADAYATALMVLGPDKGYEFALEHHLAVCLFIRTPSGEFMVRQSPEFTKYQN
jgi:FAD:protein FMN transferase